MLFDNFNFKESILLILECFNEGIGLLLINIIMNKFSFYHALIPLLIAFNLIDFFDDKASEKESIISIISLVLEIIFILIFLEIIELNFCNLNKNIKRNIEERAINEEFDNENNEDQIIYVDEENNYYIKAEAELPSKN